MGAERWLRFASVKEAHKCREHLAETTFIGVEGEFGVFLEWTKPTVLEVGYQHGCLNNVFAWMVSREISNRFRLRAIGHDSVGWFKKVGPKQYPYTSWVEWLKSYDPKRDERWYDDTEPEVWAKMQATVVDFFGNLDKGAP